ncbi:hypothetical protein ABPG75_010202 [Micractinium tetrahymenae]
MGPAVQAPATVGAAGSAGSTPATAAAAKTPAAASTAEQQQQAELRGQQGVQHTSPLVKAVVRVKAGGQHFLARVAAVSLAAGPASRGGGIELRLHLQPRPPQLRRDYVLPSELSSTNSLAEGEAYEQAGRRERAELEAWLGCAGWDLHETAVAACRLQVASTWAANLAIWMQEHGIGRLEQHLASPPQLQQRCAAIMRVVQRWGQQAPQQKQGARLKPTLPQHLRKSAVSLFARALAQAGSPAALSQLAPKMRDLSGSNWTAPEAVGLKFIEFVRLAMVSL